MALKIQKYQISFTVQLGAIEKMWSNLRCQFLYVGAKTIFGRKFDHQFEKYSLTSSEFNEIPDTFS